MIRLRHFFCWHLHLYGQLAYVGLHDTRLSPLRTKNTSRSNCMGCGRMGMPKRSITRQYSVTRSFPFKISSFLNNLHQPHEPYHYKASERKETTMVMGAGRPHHLLCFACHSMLIFFHLLSELHGAFAQIDARSAHESISLCWVELQGFVLAY